MAASDVKIIIEADSLSARKLTLDNVTWRIPSDGLDGFAEVTGSLSSQERGMFPGGMMTGYHTGITQRTIKAEAPATRENRDKISSVLALGYDYSITVLYMGAERVFYGTLSHLQVSEGNIYQPTEFTATFDCFDPFFYGSAVTRTTTGTPGSTSMTISQTVITQGQYEPTLKVSGTYEVASSLTLTSVFSLQLNLYRSKPYPPGVSRTSSLTAVVKALGSAVTSGSYDWSIAWNNDGTMTTSGLYSVTLGTNGNIGLLSRSSTQVYTYMRYESGLISSASLTTRYLPTWGGI